MTDPSPDIAALVASDPDLHAHIQQRARQFIDATFDQAMYDLETGDAAHKSAAMKQVLPLLLKTVSQDESASEKDKKLGLEILTKMQSTLPQYEAFDDADLDDEDE